MEEIKKFKQYLDEAEQADKVSENIEETDTQSESRMTKQALREKIKAEILSTLREEEGDEEEAEVEDVEVDVKAPAKPSSEPGLTSEEMEIQNSLKRAYDTAVGIGDEKLANQIANSITFFTKTHVVPRD